MKRLDSKVLNTSTEAGCVRFNRLVGQSVPRALNKVLELYPNTLPSDRSSDCWQPNRALLLPLSLSQSSMICSQAHPRVSSDQRSSACLTSALESASSCLPRVVTVSLTLLLPGPVVDHGSDLKEWFASTSSSQLVWTPTWPGT